jgi:hypothetical protein
LADHIANTSPLCYLHRAGVFRVLPAMLGRVIVPSQVVAELGAGRARGYDLPDHHFGSHAVRTTAKPQHASGPRNLSRWQSIAPKCVNCLFRLLITSTPEQSCCLS